MRKLLALNCGHCRQEFTRRPSQVRSGLKLSRSGLLFCSQECSGEYHRHKKLDEDRLIIFGTTDPYEISNIMGDRYFPRLPD